MTSLTLLSLLTSSEKRKGILFLLDEKPRTLSEIKEHFHVTSPEILPRLKEMEAAKMIVKQDGLYSLAPLGRVAAMYYKPFLDTLDAIRKPIINGKNTNSSKPSFASTQPPVKNVITDAAIPISFFEPLNSFRFITSSSES